MRSSVSFTAIAVLLGLSLHLPARADEQRPPLSPPTAEEVQALRREIQDLREQIGLLRDQVAALKAAPAQAPSPGAPSLPPPEYRPPPEAPSQEPPPPVAPTRSQNLMNPAISAVFQMIGG